MTHDILEKILSCPTLPSLPAVALRVVELTAHADVSMKDLATTIENDQALAAKVLRTVNSSFYAVRTRCATISKALVLLGLGPVKTLALGFSLVHAVSENAEPTFDYRSYWRRALFTAVAAKCLAESAKLKCSEEAFLGGLLQDVGMIAMLRALGPRYLEVLEQSGGDHRKLVKAELAAFDLQHPEIGAMMAKRWKLPDELVLPVRYHERPTAAPKECTDLVRCVGLGNTVHDALTDEDPGPAMKQVYERASQWFGLDSASVDDTVRRVALAVKEISSLFRLDTGSTADVDAVLTKAQEQLVDLARQSAGGQPSQGSDLAALVRDGNEIDPLTGAIGRLGFESTMRKAFETAQSAGESLVLLVASLDGFKTVVDTGGLDAGDEVLVGVTALLKKNFEPAGGAVCRIAPEIFAVIVRGTTQESAMALSDEFRANLLAVRQRWAKACPAALRVTVSIGAAALDAGKPSFTRFEQMIAGATRAVQISRHAGGDCARIFSARAAA